MSSESETKHVQKNGRTINDTATMAPGEETALSSDSDTAWPESGASKVSGEHTPSTRHSGFVFREKINRAGNPTPGAKFSVVGAPNGVIKQPQGLADTHNGILNLTHSKHPNEQHEDTISELKTAAVAQTNNSTLNPNKLDVDTTDVSQVATLNEMETPGSPHEGILTIPQGIDTLDDAYSSYSGSKSEAGTSGGALSARVQEEINSIPLSSHDHLPDMGSIERVLFMMENLSSDRSNTKSLSVEERIRRRKPKSKTQALLKMVKRAKQTLSDISIGGEDDGKSERSKAGSSLGQSNKALPLSRLTHADITAEFIQQSVNSTPRVSPRLSGPSSIQSESHTPRDTSDHAGMTASTGVQSEPAGAIDVNVVKAALTRASLLQPIKTTPTLLEADHGTDLATGEGSALSNENPNPRPERVSPLTVNKSPLPAISVCRSTSALSDHDTQREVSVTSHSVTSHSHYTQLDSDSGDSDNTLDDQAFPSEVDDHSDQAVPEKETSNHDQFHHETHDKISQIIEIKEDVPENNSNGHNSGEKSSQNERTETPGLDGTEHSDNSSQKNEKSKSTRNKKQFKYKIVASYEKVEIVVDNLSVQTEDTVSPRPNEQTAVPQYPKKRPAHDKRKHVRFKKEPSKTKTGTQTRAKTKKQKERQEEEVRRRLQTAMQSGNRQDLETALRDVHQHHVHVDEDQLLDACSQIDFMKTSDSLRDAFEKRHTERLKYALTHCQRMGYGQLLRSEITQAQQFLVSQQRLDSLKKDVVAMDTELLAEIRRYQKPRPLVHKVVQATLLLLGEHEGRTKSWKRCQRLLNTVGRGGLLGRVRQLEVDALPPQLVARCRQMLLHTSPQDAKDISAGVLILYHWTTGMVEEYEKRNGLYLQYPPANPRQQRRLLRMRKQLQSQNQDGRQTTLTSKSNLTTKQLQPQNQHGQQTTPTSKSNLTTKLPALVRFAMLNKLRSKDLNPRRPQSCKIDLPQIKETGKSLSLTNSPRDDKMSHHRSLSAWVKTRQLYGQPGAKPGQNCAVCENPQSPKVKEKLPCVYHEKTMPIS